MAQIFIAKLQLLLADVSRHMNEVQKQLRSAIQSRLSFLDLYEANFDKLRLIMDVQFQPRHAWRVTNEALKRMYHSQ